MIRTIEKFYNGEDITVEELKPIFFDNLYETSDDEYRKIWDFCQVIETRYGIPWDDREEGERTWMGGFRIGETTFPNHFHGAALMII